LPPAAVTRIGVAALKSFGSIMAMWLEPSAIPREVPN
jgi:hypothetical protein